MCECVSCNFLACEDPCIPSLGDSMHTPRKASECLLLPLGLLMFLCVDIPGCGPVTIKATVFRHKLGLP